MATVYYRDWSSLLPELLEQVATCIKIYPDYVRFRAVCNPWRSSTPTTPTHLPYQLPWLLFPRGGSIFSVDCNKNHDLRLPEPLHDDHHRRCRGSSHGWVFISEPIDFDDRPTGWVFILNPLTGAKLSLPPLLSLLDDDVGSRINQYPESVRRRWKYKCDSFVRKFTLSDSPSRNPDFTALAILRRRGELACCKPGQNQWTLVPGTDTQIRDVVYLKGMVYAVDRSGNITICDVSRDSPEVVGVMPIGGFEHAGTCYLVSSACDEPELILVARFGGCLETCKFKVYKLNSSEKRWEGVHDLRDLALFVGGDSCSRAVTASHFPGCERNSIYFTEDSFYGIVGETPDMGIFRLEDESVRPRLPTQDTNRLVDACNFPAHPIWITPYPF